MAINIGGDIYSAGVLGVHRMARSPRTKTHENIVVEDLEPGDRVPFLLTTDDPEGVREVWTVVSSERHFPEHNPHDEKLRITWDNGSTFGYRLGEHIARELPSVTGEDLKSAQSAVEETEAALAAARTELTATVQRALAQGMRAVEVGEALGVSRALVYQLRDGRR